MGQQRLATPQLSLAHNLLRSFQLIDAGYAQAVLAQADLRFALRSMRMRRFLLIARGGRVARIDGRHVLRLTTNPATESPYGRMGPCPWRLSYFRIRV
jgi:hypothetical protein